MQTHNTDALIQGLFDCGSYEKGQAFIKDHAGEITREFVSALRATSMDLLTGEQAAPDLAPIFAKLAFVAATVLGDDDEKGLARYCEGSILARLGNHHQAILRFAEAETYLRIGTNSQQLANCLYDQAICHHKLGELSRALRLLEEALPYQNTEKERADTRAFLLVLEQQRGNLTGMEDINDFIRRAFAPSSNRRIQFRETTDLQEKSRICNSLASHHPVLKDQELFRNSIPHFLATSDYRFFTAADTAQNSEQWPPYAYGVVK